jgi:hypothetical protein
MRRREEAIRAIVQKAGYKTSVSSVAYANQTQQRQLEFTLQWRGVAQIVDVPPFPKSDPHVVAAQWKVS